MSPGYFASSGLNGACIAVPYVERSLTKGLKNVLHICCPGDRRVVGGIGPYILVSMLGELGGVADQVDEQLPPAHGVAGGEEIG